MIKHQFTFPTTTGNITCFCPPEFLGDFCEIDANTTTTTTTKGTSKVTSLLSTTSRRSTSVTVVSSTTSPQSTISPLGK